MSARGVEKASALFMRACQALVRLAPLSYRKQWGGPTATMVRDLCMTSGQEGGIRGLIGRGLPELVDVARTVIRLRLGRWPTITAGPARGRTSSRSTRISHRRWGHDVRHAVRRLRGTPTHTAVALLTLALGIGLNSAVFSILDAVLFRPLPFNDAGRLVELATYYPARKLIFPGLSRPALLEWRKQTDLFDRVEAFERTSFVYADPSGAETVAGADVTPGLFATLGVGPAIGRPFRPNDGTDVTNLVAIASDRFWRAHLHGDPDAIGRSIVLDDKVVTLVGIMPPSFRFPEELEDIWLPVNVEPPPAGSTTPLTMVPLARVVRGVKMAQVEDQVITRGAALNAAGVGDPTATAKAVVPGLFVDDMTRTSLLVLGGAAGFLLLIVCANLANLSLAQSLAQARDFAVRAALGASRLDLIRETFIESLLIGACGSAAGLGIAAAAIRLALAVMPSEMTTHSFNVVAVDWRVGTLTAVTGLVAAGLFGLPPALVASRASITDVLRRETPLTTGSPSSRRARAGLAVVEVSLSIVLLVGAALMTRSLMNLQAIDKGLDPKGLIALQLGLPAPTYTDERLQNQFLRMAVEQLRRVPGVTGATAGTVPPTFSAVKFGPIELLGEPSADREPLTTSLPVALYQVPPDFFSTLGIPLLEGRTFRDDDEDGAVVVSRSFARTHWPTGIATGGRFRFGSEDSWMTVVGVAATVQNGAETGGTNRSQLYVAFGRPSNAYRPVRPSSTIAAFRTVVVRASRPTAVVAGLAGVIHAVDPRVIIDKREFVEHQFADAIAKPRVVFLLMNMFAGFALLLAAAGIYGVLSCLVAQRLREFGIRLALGATPSQVGRLILGSGLSLTVVGLACGTSLALVLMRAMRTLLYQVGPTDAGSVSLVSIVLLATAFAAAWRPAHRAMRIDPIRLLRDE